MSSFLEMMLPIVAQILGVVFSEDHIRTYGDRLFDLVEDVVRDSATPIDDALVLPVIRAMRVALNLPDGDPAHEEA